MRWWCVAAVTLFIVYDQPDWAVPFLVGTVVFAIGATRRFGQQVGSEGARVMAEFTDIRFGNPKEWDPLHESLISSVLEFAMHRQQDRG
jgi:hypothetical protein